jgi:hypothetical protein
VWATHCTVNRGVWIWGDWLLTLRGSLRPDLADKQPERRVVIALSWLSVESPASLVPSDIVVARGSETRQERNKKVNARFRAILKKLNVKQVDDWIGSCGPALEARIRDDAVWVDRFGGFETLAKKYRGALSQEWATSTFFDLIGGEKEYFSMPDVDGEAATESKDFVIKAGNWLSANWGSGPKSDSSSIAENLSKLPGVRADRVVGRSGANSLVVLLRALGGEVEDEIDDVAKLEKLVSGTVGWKGRTSKGRIALRRLASAQAVSKTLWDEVKEKLREEATDQSKKSESTVTLDCMPRLRNEIESQIRMPFRISRDHQKEYAVMLDHALRRVSAAHTWIKRAEASRQKFQADATKLREVPVAAQEWLQRYCDERSRESGALEEYLIRRNALDGWKEVVKAWKKCKDRKGRIMAARAVQREWPESKKFGDIQLFSGLGDGDADQPPMSLADDDAACVWHNENGKADDGLLSKYVAARIAEHDQRRFKVPAYRHPDPLRHPVWVDFGKSRWDISYAALDAAQRGQKLRQKIAAAKTAATRSKLEEMLAAETNASGVTLGLWNGSGFEPVSMRWESKRLRKDLALHQVKPSGPEVSRADRFGRAAAGADGRSVNVAKVFGEKEEWSGRLQANRAELDRLADLIYGKADSQKNPPTYEAVLQPFNESTVKRWKQLRWFLSYSAKLIPTGPWLTERVPTLPDGWEWIEPKNPGRRPYLKISANEKRTGEGSRRTRLKLSRLPLRVLSFDLGHRYAAACAVWESISTKTLQTEIAGRKLVSGGMSANEMFLHTEHKDARTGKLRRTIYRRIAGDKLQHGKLHPAPWARLVRQFVIKLQGEDKAARKPRVDEIEKFYSHVHQLSGIAIDQLKVAASRMRMNELMSLAADEVRAALRRHGDVARIADAFQSHIKQLAGGRKYYFFAENPGTTGDSPQKRAENFRLFLLDAVVLWHELRKGQYRGRAWEHKAVSEIWTTYLRPLLDDRVLEPISKSEDEETSLQRKSRLKAVEKSLEPLAIKLAGDAKLRATLAAEFTKVWRDEESQWTGQAGHLRWLRRFLLPRLGKKPHLASPEYDLWKQQAGAIRNVGGLSIDRIATILKLYQIMRAFHTRPEPNNLRAGIERIEEEANRELRFGQRILDTLDQLRENRIKQLASRLVEAALGIGSEDKEKHWDGGTKRPRQRIESKTHDKRFLPCHAVIGEDLENYKPEQTRLRSENKRIRDWAARNVRKYIIEGCQLNGLYFDEVSPRWTSQQDSRTGAPGIRCEDVAVEDFLKRKKSIDSAKKGERARDRFIAALAERFQGSGTESEQKQLLRIPNKSGELFVSGDPNSSTANGIQADLNAAANIGLRALADPDWWGMWWFVPVRSADGATDPKDFPGCPLFERPVQLLAKAGNERDGSDEEKAPLPIREKTYAWSDVSAQPPSARDAVWKSTPHYWNDVEFGIVKRLAKSLKLLI